MNSCTASTPSKLLTGSTRLHVVLGGAGEFNAIEQEKILLRTISIDREVVSVGGIRNADAAGFLPGEIDDAGIEREQLIEASAVERQILNLELADDSRCIGGGDGHDRRIALHRHLLAGFANLQRQIHRRALIDSQFNAGSDRLLETGFLGVNLVLPNRQRGNLIVAHAVGHGFADRSGFRVGRGHRCAGNHGARLVRNGSRDHRRYLRQERDRAHESKPGDPTSFCHVSLSLPKH